MFLMGTTSKWKCQTLYKALEASGDFEPFVALSRMDIEAEMSHDEFLGRLEEKRAFCRQNGLTFVEAYSIEANKPLELSAFSPDIVFYPVPWSIPENQSPQLVSNFALTCYVPYYVVCHDGAEMDSQQELHTLVFIYFTSNRYWSDFFNRKRYGWPIAGTFVGVGHPMLDCYAEAEKQFSRNDYVIYAPHFSILDIAERYSTFLENGWFILEYAKTHPDIKWCFKPHPTLSFALAKYAGWTQEQIEAYYAEWRKVGKVCLSGDYPALFLQSRALITDCSSFLMEYSAVNRPLIHLTRRDSIYKVAKPCRRLFGTFYKAGNRKELERALKVVLEDGEDPQADEREVAIRELNLWHVRCANTILNYLRCELATNAEDFNPRHFHVF